MLKILIITMLMVNIASAGGLVDSDLANIIKIIGNGNVTSLEVSPYQNTGFWLITYEVLHGPEQSVMGDHVGGFVPMDESGPTVVLNYDKNGPRPDGLFKDDLVEIMKILDYGSIRRLHINHSEEDSIWSGNFISFNNSFGIFVSDGTEFIWF
jgi:hypothetical protein